MNERPNYYAVIPAVVRYDERLRANEKLLFGEITALTYSTGECWASNDYFSRLYGVSKQAVSKWILNLQKAGYISIKYLYVDGKKEIDKRIIEVSTKVAEVSTYVDGGINKSLSGYQQKVKENNTSINNTSMNKNIYGEFQNVLLTDEEYQKVTDSGYLPILEELSCYIASSGKKYKSHYATILNWSRRKGQEKRQKSGKLKSKPTYDINDIQARSESGADIEKLLEELV
jgi:hypothetical protein